MLDANFWQDKDNSKKVIKEKKLYEDLVNSLNQSIQKLNDFDDLTEVACQSAVILAQPCIFRLRVIGHQVIWSFSLLAT